jgi:hypothetical protein
VSKVYEIAAGKTGVWGEQMRGNEYLVEPNGRSFSRPLSYDDLLDVIVNKQEFRTSGLGWGSDGVDGRDVLLSQKAVNRLTNISEIQQTIKRFFCRNSRGGFHIIIYYHNAISNGPSHRSEAKRANKGTKLFVDLLTATGLYYLRIMYV